MGTYLLVRTKVQNFESWKEPTMYIFPSDKSTDLPKSAR